VGANLLACRSKKASLLMKVISRSSVMAITALLPNRTTAKDLFISSTHAGGGLARSRLAMAAIALSRSRTRSSI